MRRGQRRIHTANHAQIIAKRLRAATLPLLRALHPVLSHAAGSFRVAHR
jgi:hypothetical protein